MKRTLCLFISLALLFLVKTNSANQVKIVSCEASFNQGGFDYSESFDGGLRSDENDGWAVSPQGVPQNVVYELEGPTHLNHIRFMTSFRRDGHHLTSFSLEGIVSYIPNLYFMFYVTTFLSVVHN